MGELKYLRVHIYLWFRVMSHLPSPRIEDLTVDMVMSKNPITAPSSSSILEVSKVMRDRNVGSVIIVDDDKPVGIVTERDLVVKVLASGMDSGNHVSTIMSKPLITIKPSIRIVDAAKIMAKNNIRRLVVMDGNVMVGIITEKDILKVAPEIIEILLETIKINRFEESYSGGGFMTGYCDNCGEWSDELLEVNGEFLCQDCRKIKG
ncbi:MAG: CBS domain-containing protein [Candidatus Methanomethylicia archaeon]